MGVGSTQPGDESPASPFKPLQAIVALGGIQALTMAAGLARTKVLALLLGPAGLGVASVVDQVLSLIAQLGSLSIPFAALKYLSRSRDSSDEETRRIYNAFVLLLTVAAIGFALVACVVAAARPSLFGDGLTAFRTPLIVALLGVPPFALMPLLRNALAALERHRESAVAALIAAVLSIGGSALGVQIGGLTGLYVANGIVLLVTIAGMQWYLGGSLRLGLSRASSVAEAFRLLKAQPGLWTFASSMYVLALTSPLAYLFARSTLLSTHGAAEAGLAAAVYGIAVSIRLVLTQANALYLTPLVNRSRPKGERIAAVAEYLRILVVLVTLSALLVVLFPRQWLLLLYSARFVAAFPLVTVFVLAETVLLVAGVYQTLLVGFDDSRGYLLSTVAGHLLTIMVAHSLAVARGGFGVGLAFLAGNSVILIATATRSVRRHHAARVLTPLLAFGVAVSGIAAAGWWASSSNTPGVALRVAVYAGAAVLAFAFLRPDERRWIVRPWYAPRLTPGPVVSDEHASG
jgi:O-antigen/teichoic acid export membrane protein